MAVWLWTTLSVAFMVVALLLTKQLPIKSAWLISPYLSVVLFLLIFGCMAGLVITSRISYQNRRLSRILAAVFIVSAVALGIIRVHSVQAVYETKRLTKPICLTATVQIKELSDSPYLPAYGVAFRQKAIISDLKLADTQAGSDVVNNPFYNPALEENFTKNWQERMDGLPKTMTVLLYAPPHTPSKKATSDPLAALSDLTVGKQATLTLSLEPIVPTDAVGFDSYEWLLTRHIHANARVLAMDSVSVKDIKDDSISLSLQRLREKYRLVFLDKWQQAKNNRQAYAIALSLLTGDRGLIDRQTKEQYQYAGISHLLAISGTHVLFLAVLMVGFITYLVDRLYPMVYVRLPKWQMRWGLMVMVSLVYAMFTGFEVPAKRTVYMLVAVGAARLLLIPWWPIKVLAVVGWLMVWLDPYVLWQAGFWLSFVAVAILMSYEWSPKGDVYGLHKITKPFVLQWYIFVAMLPISILLFGKVSLLGMAVNLVAVGLFGWVVVPLNLLAGAMYGIAPAVSYLIWEALVWVLANLGFGIDWLALTFSSAWLIANIPLAVLVLFGLATVMMTAKATPKRWAMIPLVGAVAGLGMITPTSDTLKMTVLTTDNPALSQTLLTQGNNAWLILGIQPSKKPLDPKKLGDELVGLLKKQGIDNLTGVIVQNDNDTLAKAVGYASLSLPIKGFWHPTQAHYGNATFERCRAGLELSIEGTAVKTEQSLATLQIITGWQEIGEREMHVCTVFVQSSQKLKMIDSKGVELTDNPTTAVVIDSSESDKLWGVYQLLCRPEQTAFADVFLTHSQSYVDKQAVDFVGGAVIFNNHLANPEQKATANQRYAILNGH